MQVQWFASHPIFTGPETDVYNTFIHTCIHTHAVETGLGVTVSSAAPMLRSSGATLWMLDIHGNTGPVTAGYGNDGGSYDGGGGSSSSSKTAAGYDAYSGYGTPGTSPSTSDYVGYYSDSSYGSSSSSYAGTSTDPTFNPMISFNMTLPGTDPSQYPGKLPGTDPSQQ